MIARRNLLIGLGGIALAAGAWGTGVYRATMAAAEARIVRRSSIIQTTAGALEYAVAGRGLPLMMIHGTGGGFDQGLLFAMLTRGGLSDRRAFALRPSAQRLPQGCLTGPPGGCARGVARPSRHRPDRRGGGLGGSAHSSRICSAPSGPLFASRPHRAGVESDGPRSGGTHSIAARACPQLGCLVLGFGTSAPETLLRTLLSTDPGLLASVSSEERRRADLIREGLMPISRKTEGLRSDGFWAGTPTSTAYGNIAVPITVPTLILSCDDDLFGTADTARILVDVPGARLVIYHGGHIWLGRDADLTQEVHEFITGTPHP